MTAMKSCIEHVDRRSTRFANSNLCGARKDEYEENTHRGHFQELVSFKAKESCMEDGSIEEKRSL